MFYIGWGNRFFKNKSKLGLDFLTLIDDNLTMEREIGSLTQNRKGDKHGKNRKLHS